ncbi:MAG: twin-arginine translocation signal domain-containing protein, partial [Akkermansiaceae bacterium]|nr:twin-arginine translocation signal domain-containing protein [Akkermansiaceae bacterium]
MSIVQFSDRWCTDRRDFLGGITSTACLAAVGNICGGIYDCMVVASPGGSNTSLHVHMDGGARCCGTGMPHKHAAPNQRLSRSLA